MQLGPTRSAAGNATAAGSTALDDDTSGGSPPGIVAVNLASKWQEDAAEDATEDAPEAACIAAPEITWNKTTRRWEPAAAATTLRLNLMIFIV